MKNVQININGAGIFSKFVRSIDMVYKNNYNNFILYTTPCYRINFTHNYFSYVFDFKDIKIDFIEDCDVFSTHTDISKSFNFDSLKRSSQSLKFQSNILNNVNNYVKNYLTDSTLGVHVRLTDMHSMHPQYGIFGLDRYISAIDNQLSSNKYDCIYVSSDNYESIEKLQKYYGKLIKFLNCNFLVQKEVDDNYKMQLSNLEKESMWIEVFTDMLILSKSCHLIHRVSNYANAALLFSNTIKDNTIFVRQ